MNGNQRDMAPDWVDPDDIPDLSTDEWARVVEAAPVRPGAKGSTDAPPGPAQIGGVQT